MVAEIHAQHGTRPLTPEEFEQKLGDLPRRRGIAVPAPGRDRVLVAVRIDPEVWREEVERLDPGSRGRLAAERERPWLVRDGVDLTQLQRCAEVGRWDAVARILEGAVPIGDGPPSERPFGMVFS